MSGWGGREAQRARDQWRPAVTSGAVLCCRCGKPIRPDPAKRGHGWQVDHWPIPREFGGTETWPAHSLCNMSAGGRRGAEITNARKLEAKQLERMPSERERRIRGR